jgi:tetratricopeptide (TPR) repeat protein
VLFGVLVGWIIGSQQAAPQSTAVPAAVSLSSANRAAGEPSAQPLDESRAAALAATAQKNPKDEATRVQLGNMYFDAERYQEAANWYEQAVAIDPKHAKTLLNVGIVRAFGKQDLRGAAEAWQRALDAAPPGSDEAKAAQQALEGVKAAHPDIAPSGKGTSN